MDMKKRTLKFVIDNEDKNDNDSLYNNIPIEKPLFPAILLYNENESLVFLEQ